MIRIAIFVEGMTEQKFVERLIIELLGKRKINFDLRSNRVTSTSTAISYQAQNDCEFDVLIFDCCGESRVSTKIIDDYQLLVNAGFSVILGLRDIYPLTHAEIPNIESALSSIMPSGSINPKIHLAILEIETWFIEEKTHFIKVDQRLTSEFISSNGIQIPSPASALPNPAQTLNEIYHLVNLAYRKKSSQVERTVAALSFDEIYMNARSKLSDLDEFINALETVMFP